MIMSVSHLQVSVAIPVAAFLLSFTGWNAHSGIGLTADGRILIDKAQVECQSHRLTVEDPVSIEYITKHVAGIQQVV